MVTASGSVTPAAPVSDPKRKRVLLAAPRGYCAGVDRAVQTVEKALEQYGAPVYVRKQIVHNKHVVQTLEEQGAIFVEENAEVPEGAIVIFSAHGVAPEVHEQAAQRKLRAIDATCPLVTKVHKEALRFADEGYDILLRTSSWSTGPRAWPTWRCATRPGWRGCPRPHFRSTRPCRPWRSSRRSSPS
jgi:4-hydroxy-3-methylbut-2-enyl diphosphate reductase